MSRRTASSVSEMNPHVLRQPVPKSTRKHKSRPNNITTIELAESTSPINLPSPVIACPPNTPNSTLRIHRNPHVRPTRSDIHEFDYQNSDLMSIVSNSDDSLIGLQSAIDEVSKLSIENNILNIDNASISKERDILKARNAILESRDNRRTERYDLLAAENDILKLIRTELNIKIADITANNENLVKENADNKMLYDWRCSNLDNTINLCNRYHDLDVAHDYYEEFLLRLTETKMREWDAYVNYIYRLMVLILLISHGIVYICLNHTKVSYYSWILAAFTIYVFYTMSWIGRKMKKLKSMPNAEINVHKTKIINISDTVLHMASCLSFGMRSHENK